MENKTLKEQIEDILKFKSKNRNVDVRTIADELRKNHSEYARKKYAPFCTQVERILQDLGRSTLSANKRMRKNQLRQGKQTQNEDESDTVAEPENYQTHNTSNIGMRNLYAPIVTPKDDINDDIIMIDRTVKNEPSTAKFASSDENNAKRRKTQMLGTSKDPLRISSRLHKDDWLSEIFDDTDSIPKITFDLVGGYERQKSQILEQCTHLSDPSLYIKLGVRPPNGILLHGPPGCGKSLIARAIAGTLNLPLYELTAPRLITGISGDSESRIRLLFDFAKERAPCILFLDELDSVATKRNDGNRQMESRIVAQLINCIDEINKVDNAIESEQVEKHVLVIGATSRLHSLDASLRRAGRFDEEIGLGMPDETEREQILFLLTQGMKLEESIDIRQLAKLTPGCVGADLIGVIRKASMNAIKRLRDVNSNDDDIKITLEDFIVASKQILPSALREGFATVPDVKWSDVGALANVREQLLWAIVYPIKYRERFDQFGLANTAQGVLLYGPPGCGKTLLAKAIANESCMNFLSVKGPELLNMYVGESERAVRALFQRARNSSPCVIFFDEIDALAPRRSDNESGASARVVNQLLTEMDGVETQRDAKGGVYIIAATNRPDMVDPALMRPGRLDQLIFVPLPDQNDRKDILKALSNNFTKPMFAADIVFEEILLRTEHFSGADMAALLREAAVCALRESIAATENGMNILPTDNAVHNQHFEQALEKVRPSVNEKQRLQYEKMHLMKMRK